jgi:hypothetical protein
MDRVHDLSSVVVTCHRQIDRYVSARERSFAAGMRALLAWKVLVGDLALLADEG